MTNRGRYVSMWAGLVGVLLLMPVTPGSAQESEAQESGADMWGRACGRCHRAQPPNKYDADAWRAIMRHMALNARLTPEEEEAITEFLMAAARPLSAAPVSRRERGEVARDASPDRGAAVYGTQCAACHGDEGKGDGPVAAALTPRPTDLTRSEAIRAMSDEELFELLSVGRGSMPGFGEILTEQELMDLVAWLRSQNQPSP